MKAERPKAIRRPRLALNPSTVDYPAVGALMASVGMRVRNPAQMRRAVAGSSDVVVASLGGEIVGFGRLVSDGVYYGTIWDVAVRPDLQGEGIGTRILERLMNRARRRKLYMVGLFTASHNRAFYERLGFKFLDDVHAMTTAARGSHDGAETCEGGLA